MKTLPTPWTPSPALLEANPHFRSLWEWIRNSLEDPKPSETEIGKLKSVKIRYLVRRTLLDELHEFTTEAMQHQSISDSESRLFKSLHHSLMVAGAMQSLRLPPNGDQEDFLLGLSPKEFVHRVMDIHRCQTLNQDLIPQFQTLLESVFDKVIGFCGAYVRQGENVEESILKLTKKQDLETVQWEVLNSALSALIDAHEEMKSTWDTIAQLLGHHVLDKQLEKDKERLEYQEMLIRLHKVHTKSLHLHILNECYSPEAIKALTVVRNLIDQESNEASHQLQHLNDQLDMCRKLGPEYQRLAAEYSLTKESLRQAKQTLKDLEDIEDDLDTMHSEHSPN